MAISTSELHSQYDYMYSRMQHDLNREMEQRMREQEKRMFHPNWFIDETNSATPIPQPVSKPKSNSKLILLCEDI